MTREQFNKYNDNMNKIREIESTKKLVKVQGFKVKELYDCFGHCNENNDIVFDVEFKTECSYYNLRNIPIENLTFENNKIPLTSL